MNLIPHLTKNPSLLRACYKSVISSYLDAHLCFARIRYLALFMCMRFDDKKTRNRADKLAPIREVVYVSKSATCYRYGN